MSQGGRGNDSLEARLAALRGQLEAGFADRARAFRAAAKGLESGTAGALDEIRRLAHRLRGIAATHGHDTLGSQAAALEMATAEASPGDPACAQDLAAKARALAERLEEVSTMGDGEKSAPLLERAPRPLGESADEVATRAVSTATAGRVLAVDDEPELVRMMHLVLGRLARCDVTVVDNAEDAWQLLEGAPFDLVLVDAMMPGTSGLDLCRRIRRTPSLARTRVIVLSAASPEEVAQRAASAGDTTALLAGSDAPDAWWQKPVRPLELARRVRAILDD